MSKKHWSNILSVLARTALAFVFVFGQTAWAGQNQNVSDKPTSNAVVKPPQTPPNPFSTGSKAQPQAAGERTSTAQNSSAEGRSERGGQHEGITVHGHWSIEVHNPDGSLVRHVEFENSLDPGATIPNPIAGQPPFVVPGGASFLSAVLAGQWSQPDVSAVASQVPPFWAIYLLGGVGLSNIFNTSNSPCVFNSTPPEGVCSIQQVIPPNSCTTNSPGFSCNLSVSALGTAPAFTGIQLSGSVIAQQNGQISTVLTAIQSVVCLGATPSNCLGNAGASASFTSSTNFPGAPISVIAGQTVAVTVNISFS